MVNFSEQNPNEDFEDMARKKVEALSREAEEANYIAIHSYAGAMKKGIEKGKQIIDLQKEAMQLMEEYNSKFPGKIIPKERKAEAEALLARIEELDRQIAFLQTETEVNLENISSIEDRAEELQRRAQNIEDQVFPRDPSLN
jgi:hypothetical protein